MEQTPKSLIILRRFTVALIVAAFVALILCFMGWHGLTVILAPVLLVLGLVGLCIGSVAVCVLMLRVHRWLFPGSDYRLTRQ